MPLISVDHKTVSTNDSELHKQLKILAAQQSTSLGKLVDIYLKVGFELRLDKAENFEKIKRILEEDST